MTSLFRSLLIVTAGLLCPLQVSAHILLNMGLQEPDPNKPAIPEQYTAEPIADQETQQMAMDMTNADCSKLEALDHDVKHAFLVTTTFLQTPGSLSKIIGPDCQFLGTVEKIAAITDDSLTLDTAREILYYIPDMNALIVSHMEHDSIAYGLFLNEEDPLEYFLENREEAERSASFAKSYAKIVADFALPIFDPDRAPVQKVQKGDLASSPKAQKAESSRTREYSAATTSVSPLLPTGTDTAPGFTPPKKDMPIPPPPTDTASPVQVAQGDFNVIYVEKPVDTLPNIQPLGPVPQQGAPSPGVGYWAFMIFLTFVLIGTAVMVLKNRVTAKKGMIDE